MKPVFAWILGWLSISGLVSTCLPRISSGRGAVAVNHLSIVVSNITESLKFYRNLLGGVLLEDVSSLEYVSGDDYHHLFVESWLKTSGMDLRVNQTHQVSWAFVLYDNMMLKLVAFKSVNSTESDDSPASSTTNPLQALMQPAVTFWLWDSVDFTTYVETLENEAKLLGLDKVRFMKPLLVDKSADSRPANQNVKKLRSTMLRGLSIGYASGPDGESIKLIQLVGESKKAFGQHYCKSATVSSAFLDKYTVDKCGLYKVNLTSSLYGINHLSLMAPDLNKYIDYFVEKLGAYLIDNIQPSGLQSPSFKGLFDAPLPHGSSSRDFSPKTDDNIPKSDGKEPEKPPTLETPSKQGMEHTSGNFALSLRYVLLGNIKIELAHFSGPMLTRGSAMFAKSATQAGKPSIYGTARVNFGFKSQDDLNKFLTENQELHSVNIQEIRDGPLTGLSYAAIQGPDELTTFGLIHLKGRIKRSIHIAMRDLGAVSSTFSYLNPNLYHGYEEFCSGISGSSKDEL